MIEVELSLCIRGNYGCEITRTHEGLILDVVSGYTKEGAVQGLIKSNYSSEELHKLQEEFEKFDCVKDFEVLESGYARIVIDSQSSRFPLARLIHEMSGFYIYPIRFSMGREVCTLILEDKKSLQEMLQHLGADWKIIRIGNVNVQFDLEELTPQQLRAVNLAIEKGYFEIPKKVNLDALSKQMKISRATFLEHLRKAEKKMLSKYFDMED